MSRKDFLSVTLILAGANLITKCMGFFYRVFMAQTIGNEGMGLYQLILPIYMLTWSITSSGFTTTISKLTSQEKAKSQYRSMGKILKVSLVLCLCISAVVSSILFFFAEDIAIHIIKEARTALSLQILALAVPFMAAGSCIRGHFYGLQKAVIPAISQVLEQLVRIGVIYLLASFFVPLGLSYACAAAVIGIVFGEILSFCFVFTGYRRHRTKQPRGMDHMGSRQALSLITSMAIPLTASRITSSFLSTAENILIPQRLQLFGMSSSDAIGLYGQLTGMAVPLLMLPSAFLLAVSVSLVPEISQASAVHQTTKINRTVSAALLFTAMIGIGVAACFAVFPREICYIVYSQSELGSLLLPLALLCPFIYLQMTLGGLLNGLGKHLFLFKNNVLGSLISIFFIVFGMPRFGIAAYLAGWLLTLLITTGLSLRQIHLLTGVRLAFFSCFGKPLLAGAASALIIRYLIQIGEPSKLLFLLSLSAMLLLYLVFLTLLGCLQKEDLAFVLPFRKKPK